MGLVVIGGLVSLFLLLEPGGWVGVHGDLLEKIC